MPALPRTYLEAAYEVLGYRQGALLSVHAGCDEVPEAQWLAVEDWLALGQEVGADAIFFVDDSPVIVFAECSADRLEMLKAFNKVWNMARPALLFLATPGSLSAYHLSRPPLRNEAEWRQVEPLAVVERVADVAESLAKFRREMVEAGQVFDNKRFKRHADRADRALIRDLQTVRQRLFELGLDGDKVPYAHALIGRSIFIRYLEDRKILNQKYFEKVAGDRDDWQHLLRKPLEKPDINPEMKGLLYPRVLENKEFTYALYDQLSFDFNGDIFPTGSEERKHIRIDHLRELRDMFLGDAGPQKSLFFWAYRFNIIPIELISSIYEEFYHSGRQEADDKGTHYTPSSLVDFTLSRALTAARLNERPRVIDPACGSGIFLVEAFRRIVRYERRRQGGRQLEPDELLEILRNQIAGIEINPEAVRVAAFSLYLALLNYIEPPDILRAIASEFL